MTNRRFFLTALKRLIDIAIGISALLLLIFVITGEFKLGFMGISIKILELSTPIKILVPLVFFRLLVTVDIKNMVLIVVGVFLSLFIVEIVLRLWAPPIAGQGMAQIYQPSSFFTWDLIPGESGNGVNGNSIHINSAGFRDEESSLRKQAGIHRIMVIGDSFTFGSGVNVEDTYCEQLERLLHNTNSPHEVINCGVVGYDMWQYFEVLKRKVLPYQPDLVIIGVFFDDIGASRPPYEDSNEWKGGLPYKKKTPGLMNHFYTMNFIKNCNYQFETRIRYLINGGYLKYIEKRKGRFKSTLDKTVIDKMEEQKRSDFTETLQKFVSTAKTSGSEVLIVMIPDAVQLHDPQMQGINHFVKQACLRIGVHFIDTTPRFEKESDPASLYLFPVDPHTSPKGHRIIAEAIADQIKKFALLSY